MAQLVRRVVVAAMLVAAVVSCIGCSSSSSPSGPDSIVGDLYIGGAYIFMPAGRPAGFANGAFVIVRDGSQTGPVVSDLTVKINDHQLTFEQSLGLYTGVAPGLVSGDNVTISVSDGLGTRSKTVQVPYAPSDLQLLGGAWDVSSSWATNTLNWDNPIVVGQAIVTYLYDYDGVDADLIHYAAADLPNSITYTVANYDLAYFVGVPAVGAIVAQANYATFANNPAGSAVLVLAGVADFWPTAVRR